VPLPDTSDVNTQPLAAPVVRAKALVEKPLLKVFAPVNVCVPLSRATLLENRASASVPPLMFEAFW